MKSATTSKKDGGSVPSECNIFDADRSSSQTIAHVYRPCTEDDNRRIVEEIVDDYFDDQRGCADISSSHCASSEIHQKEYSYDKRLAYWKKVLQDRKLVEKRILDYTGKNASEVLFNRQTTLDERDKNTVKRLMDYAERLNPSNLRRRKPLTLREYRMPYTCTVVNELAETLPAAERNKCKMVEISGLPAIIKEEMLGKRKEQGEKNRSLWLRSKVLERRIEEKRDDIERVIEYYPDIENLQIIGEGIFKGKLLQHNSDINLISEEPINQISSDTVISDIIGVPNLNEEIKQEEVPEYAVKINDHTLKLTTKRSSKTVEIETNFQCDPFEKVIKRSVRLENIGLKVLTFEWIHRSFYEKNGRLLKAQDNEFLFNHSQFRLFAGEKREVVVQFQPRKVGVVKEKWLLKIEPQFFCRKVDGVAIKLCGKCKPPIEYEKKLNEVQHLVIEKSNMSMMRKFTSSVASITPILTENERICPYQRTLDECELFELENPGYKCDRFHDLELLKALYQRIKKPREHPWDFKLDTLKAMIMRLEGADQRALVFNELIGILDGMRGTPICLAEKVLNNPERDKTRFIYVRGIVSTAVDEWEDLMAAVEEGFLKPALVNFYQQVEDCVPEEEEQVNECMTYTRLLAAGEEAIQNYVLKKIRRRKIFRDSVYIQTYTHICNIVEDIVSIIESTDVI